MWELSRVTQVSFSAHFMLIMLHIMFYCNSQPQNAWNILFIVPTRRHRVILHQTTGWFLSFREENRIFMFQSIQAAYKTNLTQYKSVEHMNKQNTTARSLLEKIDSHTLLLESCIMSNNFKSTISDCGDASILYIHSMVFMTVCQSNYYSLI